MFIRLHPLGAIRPIIINIIQLNIPFVSEEEKCILQLFIFFVYHFVPNIWIPNTLDIWFLNLFQFHKKTLLKYILLENLKKNALHYCLITVTLKYTINTVMSVDKHSHPYWDSLALNSMDASARKRCCSAWIVEPSTLTLMKGSPICFVHVSITDFTVISADIWNKTVLNRI